MITYNLIQIKTLNIYLYACYHILSAYIPFHVILGYDIKIYYFIDNYA